MASKTPPRPPRKGTGKAAVGPRRRPVPDRGFPGEKVKIFKP